MIKSQFDLHPSCWMRRNCGEARVAQFEFRIRNLVHQVFWRHHLRLLRSVRITTEGIVVDAHMGRRLYSLGGTAMFLEPVMVYCTLLLGHTPDNHRSLGSSERVVADLDRGSGNVRPILPIPSTVHVKTMTERFPAFDIVTRHITATRSARARDRMAIPVEPIEFDQ